MLASTSALPLSDVMSTLKSSWCAIVRSYHFRRSLERSLGLVCRNDWKALFAAVIASVASLLVNSQHLPMFSSVVGAIDSESIQRLPGD